MSQKPPQKPPAPPHPDTIAKREAALRDNLLKRKQQQRARANTTPSTPPDTEST